jgi:hypothetical protein
MPYVVKVPENQISLTDRNDVVIKEENYFWFMIRFILNAHAQRLSGLELLDFAEIWRVVKLQIGQKTLAIKNQKDFENIKKIVMEHKGWAGSEAIEAGTAIITAFQNAERAKTKEESEE